MLDDGANLSRAPRARPAVQRPFKRAAQRHEPADFGVDVLEMAVEQLLDTLAGRLTPVGQIEDASDLRQSKAESLGFMQETQRAHRLFPIDPVAVWQAGRGTQDGPAPRNTEAGISTRRARTPMVNMIFPP